MLFYQTLKALAVFALLETSNAAPGKKHHKGRGKKGEMTIEREDTGKRVIRSGASAIQKAHRRYNVTGADLPGRRLYVSKAFGAVSATPESFDIEYLSPIQIGTPAKTLFVSFDTGSSDLWVFSNELPSSETAGHAYYVPSESKTAVEQQGQTWDISYGDGSGASGNVYMDKVVVGPVTATRQAVEAATAVSSVFSGDQELDGIMGLAGTQLNTVQPTQQWSFFRNVMPTLAFPIFAAYLKPGTRGAFDFGFLNPDHYYGEVHMTPADLSTGFWQVETCKYAVDYKIYSTSINAIVDTGTTMLFLPDDVVTNYYAKVEGAHFDTVAGGWIFNCNAKMPSLSLEFGGSMRMLPGPLINYSGYSSYMGVDYCYGGLQSSDGFPNSILGDVFIKSQYVVFDGGNSQVGFANQA